MLKKGASSLTEANETHRSLRCNKKINYEEEEEEITGINFGVIRSNKEARGGRRRRNKC